MNEIENTNDVSAINESSMAATVPVSQAPSSSTLPTIPLWGTRYGVIHDTRADDVPARSLSQYGEWVEQELDLVGALLDEGDTALQYGAEYGAHTLYLSKLVGASGQVYVVEPSRMAHIALCTTLGLNNVRNVYPHHVALGDRQAQVRVPTPSGQPEEYANMIPLDALQLPALHMLKVNMSGTLMQLLAGAGETVRKYKPAIYFRLSTMELAADEVAALKAQGYRCWSHLPYLYNTTNFAENKRNIFPGWSYQNVIAVHQDSPVNFERLPKI
jgi:FkbM family methyltransferase